MGTSKPAGVPGFNVTKKAISFSARRIFIGYNEGDNPELEPTFANHFEVFGFGADIYMDIGILKPEEVMKAGNASSDQAKPVEVPFYVLHRIAMSQETFNRLHQKVTEAQKGLEKLKKDAATVPRTD